MWKYDPASDVFSAPNTLQYALAESVAANADGSVLVAGALALSQDLQPVVPFWSTGALTNRLTASGGLRYDVSEQVDISDTRNGRSLLMTPMLND